MALNDIKRSGQGLKVDPEIEDALVDILVSMWIDGKRGRQLSADQILDRLAELKSEWIEVLPSLPTVRRIIRDRKQKLETIPSNFTDHWSLGTSTSDTDGIDQQAIPLLLEINKWMALEVRDQRRDLGFNQNRLTVKEAYWISKLMDCVPDDESLSKRVNKTEASRLVHFGKEYARYELASIIKGVDLDTYSLDMEIGFTGITLQADFLSEEYGLWTIAQEMGLIPSSGMDQVDTSIYNGDETSLDGGGIDIRNVPRNVIVDLQAILQSDPPLKVQFRSEDWDGGELFKIREYSSIGIYQVTWNLLSVIVPLANLQRELTEDDPPQVKIATAFLKKILEQWKYSPAQILQEH